MKLLKPFWYAVAVVMGIGFWTWVGAATAIGLVKTWLHNLTTAAR